MSTESFRSAVVTLVKDWMAANHPTVPVFYENGPSADQDAVGKIWLDVSIKWHDAKNVTTGIRPRGRDYGVLITNVFLKAGEGTQQSDQIVDGLRELLRNRRPAGGGVLEFPERNSTPAPLLGWYRAGLQTPFYVDSA